MSRRYPIIIRIISAITLSAFLATQVAWGYYDHIRAQAAPQLRSGQAGEGNAAGEVANALGAGQKRTRTDLNNIGESRANMAGNAIPLLASDEIACSRPGLLSVSIVNPAAAAKTINDRISTELSGNQDLTEITIEGVRFFKRKTGTQTIWAFHESDKAKVARLFGFKLKQGGKDIPAKLSSQDLKGDEIACSGPGLSPIFSGSSNIIAKTVKDRISTELSGNQDLTEIIIEGVRFFKRKTGVHPIWAFHESDKVNAARLFGFRLKQGGKDSSVEQTSLQLSLPLDVPARILEKVKSYLEAGEYDKAIAAFTEGLGLYPDEGKLLLNRGRAYLAKGALREAIVDFKLVMDRHTDLKGEADVELRKAKRRVKELDIRDSYVGFSNKAIAAFREFDRRRFSEAHRVKKCGDILLLKEIYLWTGGLSKKTRVEIDAKLAEFDLSLADSRYKDSEYRNYGEHLSGREWDEYQAYLEEFRKLAERPQSYEEALEGLNKLIGLYPDSAEAYIERTRLLIAMGIQSNKIKAELDKLRRILPVDLLDGIITDLFDEIERLEEARRSLAAAEKPRVVISPRDRQVIREALERIIDKGVKTLVIVLDVDYTLVESRTASLVSEVAGLINSLLQEGDKEGEITVHIVIHTGRPIGDMDKRIMPYLDKGPRLHLVTRHSSRYSTFNKEGEPWIGYDALGLHGNLGLPRTAKFYIQKAITAAAEETNIGRGFTQSSSDEFRSPHRVKFNFDNVDTLEELIPLARKLQQSLQMDKEKMILELKSQSEELEALFAQREVLAEIQAKIDEAITAIASTRRKSKVDRKWAELRLKDGKIPQIIDVLDIIRQKAPAVIPLFDSEAALLARFLNPENLAFGEFLRREDERINQFLSAYDQGFLDFDNSVVTFIDFISKEYRDKPALQVTFYTKVFFLKFMLKELGLPPENIVMMEDDVRPFGNGRPMFEAFPDAMRICVGEVSEAEAPKGTIILEAKFVEGARLALEVIKEGLARHKEQKHQLPSEPPVPAVSEEPDTKAKEKPKAPPKRLPQPPAVKPFDIVAMDSYSQMERFIVENGLKRIIINLDDLLFHSKEEGFLGVLQRIQTKHTVEVVIWTGRNNNTDPGVEERIPKILPILGLDANTRILHVQQDNKWALSSVLAFELKDDNGPAIFIDTDIERLERVARFCPASIALPVRYIVPQGCRAFESEQLLKRAARSDIPLAYEYILKAIEVSEKQPLKVEDRVALYDSILQSIEKLQKEGEDPAGLIFKFIPRLTGLFYELQSRPEPLSETIIKGMEHSLENLFLGYVDFTIEDPYRYAFIDVYSHYRQKEKLSFIAALKKIFPIAPAEEQYKDRGQEFTIEINEDNAYLFLQPALKTIAENPSVVCMPIETGALPFKWLLDIFYEEIGVAPAPVYSFPLSYKTVGDTEYTTEQWLRRAQAVKKGEEPDTDPRYKQMAGLFPLTGRSVLLVDDNVVTGGTVRILTNVLRHFGVRRVGVATPVRFGGEDSLGFRVAGSDFASFVFSYESVWKTYSGHLWNINRPSVVPLPVWDRPGKKHLRGVKERSRFGQANIEPLDAELQTEAGAFRQRLTEYFRKHLKILGSPITEQALTNLRQIPDIEALKNTQVIASAIEEGDEGIANYLARVPETEDLMEFVANILDYASSRSLANSIGGEFLMRREILERLLFESEIFPTEDIIETVRVLFQSGKHRNAQELKADILNLLNELKEIKAKLVSGAIEVDFKDPLYRDLYYAATYLPYDRYKTLVDVFLNNGLPLPRLNLDDMSFQGHSISFRRQTMAEFLKGLSIMPEQDPCGDQLLYQDCLSFSIYVDGENVGKLVLLDSVDSEGRKCFYIQEINFVKDTNLDESDFTEQLISHLSGVVDSCGYHYLLGPRATLGYFLSRNQSVRQYYSKAYFHYGLHDSRIALRETKDILELPLEKRMPEMYKAVAERLSRISVNFTARDRRVYEHACSVFLAGAQLAEYPDEKSRLRLSNNFFRLLNGRFRVTRNFSDLINIYSNRNAFSAQAQQEIDSLLDEINYLEFYIIDAQERQILDTIRQRIISQSELSGGHNRLLERLRSRSNLADFDLEKIQPWQRRVLRRIVLNRIKAGYVYSQPEKLLQETAHNMADWSEEEKRGYQVVELFEEMRFRRETLNESPVWPEWLLQDEYASARAEFLIEYLVCDIFYNRPIMQLKTEDFRAVYVGPWIKRFFGDRIDNIANSVYPGQYSLREGKLAAKEITPSELNAFIKDKLHLGPGRSIRYLTPKEALDVKVGEERMFAVTEMDPNQGIILRLTNEDTQEVSIFQKDPWLRGAQHVVLAVADIFDFYFNRRHITPLREWVCTTGENGNIALRHMGERLILKTGFKEGANVAICFRQDKARGVVMDVLDAQTKMLNTRFLFEQGSSRIAAKRPDELVKMDIGDFLRGRVAVSGQRLDRCPWINVTVTASAKATGRITLKLSETEDFELELWEQSPEGTEVLITIVDDESYGPLVVAYPKEDIERFNSGALYESALYPLTAYRMAQLGQPASPVNHHRLSAIDYCLERKINGRIPRPKRYYSSDSERVDDSGRLILTEGKAQLVIEGLDSIKGRRVAIVPQNDKKYEYAFVIYPLEEYLENPGCEGLFFRLDRRKMELVPMTLPQVSDGEVDAFLESISEKGLEGQLLRILEESSGQGDISYILDQFPELKGYIEELLLMMERLRMRIDTFGGGQIIDGRVSKGKPRLPRTPPVAQISDEERRLFADTEEDIKERRVRYVLKRFIKEAEKDSKRAMLLIDAAIEKESNDLDKEAMREARRRIERVSSFEAFKKEIGVTKLQIDERTFSDLKIVQRISILELLQDPQTRPHKFIAHEMGLGKTAIAVVLALCVKRDSRIEPHPIEGEVQHSGANTVLVVAPKGAFQTWKSSIERWAPLREEDKGLVRTRAHIVDGRDFFIRRATKKKRSFAQLKSIALKSEPGRPTMFFVVNYELLRPNMEPVRDFVVAFEGKTEEKDIRGTEREIDSMFFSREDIMSASGREEIKTAVWERFFKGKCQPQEEQTLKRGLDAAFKKAYFVFDELSELKPDIVYLDEAHHIRRDQTWQSYGVRGFSAQSAQIFPITGTPIITGTTQQLYTLLHMLYPAEFPDMATFRKDFPPTAEGSLLFHRVISHIISRYRKKDTLDLPPMVGEETGEPFQIEWVSFDPQQDRIYDLLAEGTSEGASVSDAQTDEPLTAADSWFIKLQRAAADPKLLKPWAEATQAAAKEAARLIEKIRAGRYADTEVEDLRAIVMKNPANYSLLLREAARAGKPALVKTIAENADLPVLSKKTTELAELVENYDTDSPSDRKLKEMADGILGKVYLIPEDAEEAGWKRQGFELTGEVVPDVSEWHFAIYNDTFPKVSPKASEGENGPKASEDENGYQAEYIANMRIAAQRAGDGANKPVVTLQLLLPKENYMPDQSRVPASQAEISDGIPEELKHVISEPDIEDRLRMSDLGIREAPINGRRAKGITEIELTPFSIGVSHGHQADTISIRCPLTGEMMHLNLPSEEVSGDRVVIVPHYFHSSGLKVTLPNGETKIIRRTDEKITIDGRRYKVEFEKVAIMTQFKDKPRPIAEMLRDYGVCYVAGREGSIREAEEAFQMDPHAAVFVATFDRAAESVTLVTDPLVLPQHIGNNLVLYDLDWWPLDQIADRINRIQQRRPTRVSIIASKGSITERSYLILAGNLALSRSAIDGPCDSAQLWTQDRFYTAHAEMERLAKHTVSLIRGIYQAHATMRYGQIEQAEAELQRLKEENEEEIENLPLFTRMVATYFELLDQIQKREYYDGALDSVHFPRMPRWGFDMSLSFFEPDASNPEGVRDRVMDKLLPQFRESGLPIESIVPISFKRHKRPDGTVSIEPIPDSLDAVISSSIEESKGAEFLDCLKQLAGSIKQQGYMILTLSRKMPEQFYTMLEEEFGLRVITEPNQPLRIEPKVLDFIAGQDEAMRERFIQDLNGAHILIAKKIISKEPDIEILKTEYPEVLKALQEDIDTETKDVAIVTHSMADMTDIDYDDVRMEQFLPDENLTVEGGVADRLEDSRKDTMAGAAGEWLSKELQGAGFTIDESETISSGLFRMKKEGLDLLERWGVLTKGERIAVEHRAPDMWPNNDAARFAAALKKEVDLYRRDITTAFTEREYVHADINMAISEAAIKRMIPWHIYLQMKKKAWPITHQSFLSAIGGLSDPESWVDEAVKAAAQIEKEGIRPGLYAWQMVAWRGRKDPKRALLWGRVMRPIVDELMVYGIGELEAWRVPLGIKQDVAIQLLLGRRVKARAKKIEAIIDKILPEVEVRITQIADELSLSPTDLRRRCATEKWTPGTFKQVVELSRNSGIPVTEIFSLMRTFGLGSKEMVNIIELQRFLESQGQTFGLGVLISQYDRASRDIKAARDLLSAEGSAAGNAAVASKPLIAILTNNVERLKQEAAQLEFYEKCNRVEILPVDISEIKGISDNWLKQKEEIERKLKPAYRVLLRIYENEDLASFIIRNIPNINSEDDLSGALEFNKAFMSIIESV